ncbi:MAG: gliding motility-associated C-terminal domain-containing protein, partial [Phaeodactylibacter sp.]|nr:gliding motility-associated C-terminal domain-containing protein [Phaeodactylibacter sp.]
DGDGLIDCDDPDLVDSCCCLNPISLDLGPDQVVCDNGIATFDAGPGFVSYLWSTNTNDPVLSVSAPGVYWLLAEDICGIQYTDTVEVILDPGTVLDFGPDQTYCSGSSGITLSASGFDTYQWFPDTYLGGCGTCPSVTIQPDASITYVVLGSTDEGCFSVDTITITVLDTSMAILDTTICDGATIIFDGMELAPGSSTPFTYQAFNGCDSTILVNVSGSGANSFFQQIDTVACMGDVVTFDGVAIPAGSEETFEYQTVEGCDSTILVVVEIILPVYDTDAITLCAGDSVLVFGNYETMAGSYMQTFTANNGCDSIHTVNVEVLDPLFVQEVFENTCKDAAMGAIDLLVSGGLAPYSYSWSGPYGNTANLSGLDAGAYAYTVTDANACTYSGELVIDVAPYPDFSFDILSPTCYDDEDGAIWVVTDDPDLTFSLDGSFYQFSPAFQYLAGGAYSVFIQDGNGCVYENELIVPTPAELLVQLPQDTTIQLGEILDVQSQVNTFDSVLYAWNPMEAVDCVNCPDQLDYAPTETVLLSLMVADTLGCSDVDSMLIRVEKPRNIYIPNAFSPNFDGVNDQFQLFTGIDVQQVLTLKIFDRWGELIYEANNYLPDVNTGGWDGTFRGVPMNPGVYTYMAEVLFIDGEQLLYTGSVHLVR